jgi:hypothetical protein
MLEGKRRFLESKFNKAPGKESDFKLAALCRRDRLPNYFCNNIGRPIATRHALVPHFGYSIETRRTRTP